MRKTVWDMEYQERGMKTFLYFILFIFVAFICAGLSIFVNVKLGFYILLIYTFLMIYKAIKK